MTSPIMLKDDFVIITGTIMAATIVEINTIYGVTLNIHDVTLDKTISFFKSLIIS